MAPHCGTAWHHRSIALGCWCSHRPAPTLQVLAQREAGGSPGSPHSLVEVAAAHSWTFGDYQNLKSSHGSRGDIASVFPAPPTDPHCCLVTWRGALGSPKSRSGSCDNTRGRMQDLHPMDAARAGQPMSKPSFSPPFLFFQRKLNPKIKAKSGRRSRRQNRTWVPSENSTRAGGNRSGSQLGALCATGRWHGEVPTSSHHATPATSPLFFHP